MTVTEHPSQTNSIHGLPEDSERATLCLAGVAEDSWLAHAVRSATRPNPLLPRCVLLTTSCRSWTKSARSRFPGYLEYLEAKLQSTQLRPAPPPTDP